MVHTRDPFRCFFFLFQKSYLLDLEIDLLCVTSRIVGLKLFDLFLFKISFGHKKWTQSVQIYYENQKKPLK